VTLSREIVVEANVDVPVTKRLPETDTLVVDALARVVCPDTLSVVNAAVIAVRMLANRLEEVALVVEALVAKILVAVALPKTALDE
jgi:hypothetical protein